MARRALAAAVLLALTTSCGSGPRTLRFTEKTVEQRTLDVDRSGTETQGDELVFRDRLTDADGTVVGSNGGVCIVTRAAPDVVYQCAVTLVLEHGQIALESLVANSAIVNGRPFPMAIVGGTGAYRGARGEATIVVESETLSRITVQVRS